MLIIAGLAAVDNLMLITLYQLWFWLVFGIIARTQEYLFIIYVAPITRIPYDMYMMIPYDMSMISRELRKHDLPKV